MTFDQQEEDVYDQLQSTVSPDTDSYYNNLQLRVQMDNKVSKGNGVSQKVRKQR